MFSAADYGFDSVDVWPENWPAWVLFADLSTQWRVGFNGMTGLDYTPLMRLLDREHPDANDWRQTFDDVRHLEAAALDQMRENRAESSP